MGGNIGLSTIGFRKLGYKNKIVILNLTNFIVLKSLKT